MNGELRFCVLLGCFVSAIVADVCVAEPMRYQWTDGQKFSYEVAIEVESPGATTTYKGLIHYSVTKGGADQSTVTYRGGLKESKSYKGSSRGGFPGRFPGPPSFSSPFSRPTFAGKTQTTNKITIGSRGGVLAMTGDSQLPYLLGNLSLIPFESLPAGQENRWDSDTGVSITEESDDRRDRFSPFGRFGPGGGSNQESKQAGGEKSSYVLAGQQGNIVNVRKTYRLFTPQADGKDTFEMKGTGTWSFDRVDHVPHACDMKISLVVKSGNSSTTVPISLKYDRISAEKLAAMEAETKRKADEAAKAKADAKALAERPLSAIEKETAMIDLRSSDPAAIQATLGILAGKSLENPDRQIVAAIESHLSSSDKKTAAAAHNAMMKWSPAYATKKNLAKAYQGPGTVKSTGLVVESITPLYVGQLVQAQRSRRGSFWRPGRIKELMSDGSVKIAFLTWGKENSRDEEIVQRRSIQLAPPELEQPARPRSRTRTTSQVRTWSDASGRFSVQATFVSNVAGKVLLKRADGRTMTIPIEKLSQRDQDFVKQTEDADNPFQLN